MKRMEYFMYRVLLVDDEALIREAISENTKWNDLGYELAGTCKNGKEAMEFIRQNPIDLLLTDICMPHMDGMELTKFVHEEHQEIKVVIISGYDEFEYAKKAVQYQVAEYILKPVTAMELSQTLLKVKEKLDDEQVKRQNMRKIRGAYVSNLPVLRGRFLNGLLQGKSNRAEVKTKLIDYDIQLTGSQFMTAMVQGDDLSTFLGQKESYKSDLGHFAIYNITEEIMNNHKCGVTFQDLEDRTILIFCGGKTLEKDALHICEEIQDTIYQYLKIKVTVGLGRMVDSLQELYSSFQSTKRALDYKFLLGGNQIIYAGNLRESQDQLIVDAQKWASRIALAIKIKSEEEIKNHVNLFISSMRDAYITKNRSILYIQNVILSIMNEIDASSLDENCIFNAERQLLNNIYQKEHLADVGDDLIRFCMILADDIHDQKDSYCKKQAFLAVDYIDKNLKDSGISLNSVCAYLNMSTSYFSSIFKAYTGETFIEALTKRRIEKAKQLFENTAMKSYEVADEVGYSDPHYFSVSFKKATGMTPTEYAKKVR